MKTRFALQYGALAVFIVIAVVTALVLLVVMGQRGLSERTLGASLLILCFVVFGVAGMLFTGRAFWKWPVSESKTYLRWERGIIIAAVLLTVLGLALLEDLLHAAGDTFLSRLGTVTYLFGAVLVVSAESDYLNTGEWNYPQVIVYVFLAFLAQAAFGVALLQTGLVASWAGWATLIWNLGWMLIMLVFRPRDIYYPVLHHVAPLIIGIALLL